MAARWWWPIDWRALTAFLARDLGLVKLAHFSLPNLLAGEALVPEFFQEAVTPAALAQSLAGLAAGRAATGGIALALHGRPPRASSGLGARGRPQVVIELAGRVAA